MNQQQLVEVYGPNGSTDFDCSASGNTNISDRTELHHSSR